MISKLPTWKKYLKPCTHDCESFRVVEYTTKTILEDEPEDSYELDIIIHHDVCSACDCTLESWQEVTSFDAYWLAQHEGE
jgi:hypothetical protein